MKELLERQKSYLDYFFETVNPKEMEAVFEKMLACRGTVFISGVGKSGLIAQKIAATLVSVGVRASFLSPTAALHGDIGSLSSEDLFLAFSKSGQSRELLDLIPHVTKRGVATIAIVSELDSQLSKLCLLAVHLPVKKELCPYNLVPTTSTAVQLIFGDCLAIRLMQAKQFTVEHFALNHPAGLLGRKINHTVADLMLKGDALPLCKGEALLIDLLHELSNKRCGCLIVVDAKQHLRGIFTDGDLRRAIHKEGAIALQKPIQEIMTQSPQTIEPHLLAFEALAKMEANPQRLITALPVVQDEIVIGLIRIHDLLQQNF